MNNATISQRYLNLIAGLGRSEKFKAAAAVSDAAMVIDNPDQGGPAGPEGQPEAQPPQGDPLYIELRARADDDKVSPEDRQLMLDAASRLEMAAAPPQVPMGQAPQEQAPQGMPQEMAPEAAPELPQKAASRGWTSAPGAEIVNNTKKASINDNEKPPTMAGFRDWLSQF